MVEDNAADVTLIRHALKLNNVRRETVVLTDGERAIDYIEQVDAEEAPCPELVILDLNLPRKDGHAVLSRIRSSKKCKSVTVVVLSSSNAELDRAAAAVLGANAYLQKPMDFDAFMSIGGALKRLLEEPLPS